MQLFMKGLIKQLQADNVGWWSFWISATLLVLVIISIGILYRQLPPFLPLYNHEPWGYQRLGRTYEIFVPILLSIIIITSNVFLGTYLTKRNPLLARFIFITSAALSFFVLIFVMRIFQVVL